MNPSSSAAAQAGEPALPTPGAAPEQPAIPGLTPPTHRGGAKRRIGEVIVDLGFAQEDRVEAAVGAAREAGKTTGQMLIDSGVLDSNQLSRALAERNGLDHVDLNVFEVDRSAATLIDSGAAKRHRTVPIAFVLGPFAGFEPAGCVRCGGSGFKGRIGLYELMEVDDEIREIILERGSEEDLRNMAIRKGMTTLREDGIGKVQEGRTSV